MGDLRGHFVFNHLQRKALQTSKPFLTDFQHATFFVGVNHRNKLGSKCNTPGTRFGPGGRHQSLAEKTPTSDENTFESAQSKTLCVSEND